ncbi:MAG: MMPL family transporter [Deltaproteobacteria bacterium]|nr:MMPL family transporter [Deltaproteobacteria bacterium]
MVTDSSPGRQSRAFVRFTLQHGRLIWIVALLLAVPAAYRTARLYLHLNSDLEQLLPRESASVKALEELRRRMPGLQYVGVVVDSAKAENLPAAERFLDDLQKRVQTYPQGLVRSVRNNANEERLFVEKNALLYADLDDLIEIKDRIAARKNWEMSKKLDVLLDPEEPAPPLDFNDLTQKYEHRADSASRFAKGRFSNAEMHCTLLLIEVGGFSTGTSLAKELLPRLKADIAALGGPGKYAAGMRLGFSGDLAVSDEEISALAADLTLSSVLVLAAVIAVLWLYFRWWRAVPVLLAPLLIATAYTFGLVTLPPFSIRELNSNTAFLGSIIVGNGINFAIVMLARYVEARRRGTQVDDALVEAVWGARVGTLVAALAAAVAYASLIITDFRGFRQFGIIGGIGMVMCWGVAFVLIPPLLKWIERKPAAAPAPRPNAKGLLTPVAQWVAKNSGLATVLGVALTLAALVPLRGLSSGQHMETDFSKLRRRDSWSHGERYWGAKMDRLLNRYLTPTVVLTNTPAEAEAVANKLREAIKGGPLRNMVSEVRSLSDIVPLNQEEKVKTLASIHRLLSPATRAQLDPATLEKVDRLLGDTLPSPFTTQDLPRTFTTGMRENNGVVGSAVLVFPSLNKALWQGDNLMVYANSLRQVAQETKTVPARVAGAYPISADIIQSIRRDGPLASAYAFIGVLLLVVLMFRISRNTLFIVGSLLVGVLWMVGLTFALGVKINFINFIAFPITFGIGVDYSVNIMARYVQEGSQDIEGPIRSTGAAVGLCSLTTIIGYSSLLLAKNHGLFLFGLVAVLGEVACLTTALILLPALLQQLSRSRRAETA